MNKRYKRTLIFLERFVSKDKKILDLGVANILSDLMKKQGYNVVNTSTINLDDDFTEVQTTDASIFTSFEVFEHLLSPYSTLKNVKCNEMVLSVPLKLWFSSAYWNTNDEYDCHYHEFEVKQIELLLKRTGWSVVYKETFPFSTSIFGFRPILRHFTKRYYLAYCKRL